MRVRGSSDAITGRPSRGSSRRSEPRPAASEPRRAAIARPTLVSRLDEALTHRLTLVVGKAGFGKSTLLSGWSSGVRSCWYTLSAADSDLDTLAGGILNALRARVPGLSVELDGAIGAWRGPEANLDERTRADALAALLCQSLDARLRRDLVLILDELHEINTPRARSASSRVSAGRRQGSSTSSPHHVRTFRLPSSAYAAQARWSR